MAQSSPLITILPDIQITILTYLRAFELASLQQTCRYFNFPSLISSVIHHAATFVYPPELTSGFDSAIVGGEVNATNGRWLTYEAMRNMEMLVVTRILSRPEPPFYEHESGFYVSKAWCRTALKWLEVQMEQPTCTPPPTTGGSKKGKKHKKLSKKQQRIRDRRLSDASPPWPNVNHDISCEHGDLRLCTSRQTRAKRRVMDKQAWKVLKKLYPDSVQFGAWKGECLQCALEAETIKKTEADKKEKEKQERKKPLSCPLVRGIYTRSKGVPPNCLVMSGLDDKQSDEYAKLVAARGHCCPLVAGVYYALPRAWCHRWRKHLKTGEGEPPYAPDASALLCDAHRLPLVPPHLEAFLYGESPSLLGAAHSETDNTTATSSAPTEEIVSPVAAVASAFAAATITTIRDINNVEEELTAAGFGHEELEAQRTAMQSFFAQRAQIEPSGEHRLARSNSSNNLASSNDYLDKENQVVVEILTEEEFVALDKWWPEIHSPYIFRFAITESEREGYDGGMMGGGGGGDNFMNRVDVTWSTPPCRECDAGHPGASYALRNRRRRWLKLAK